MAGAGSGAAVPPRPVGALLAPGPTFTLRRLAPYAAIIVLSAVSPAIPHHPHPITHWWLAAFGAIGVAALGCAVAARLPNGHWWHTVAPLLVLPIVQFLRAADGFAMSGFSPLTVLPIVWLGLYGRLRDVVIGVLAVGAMLVWPILVIGAPRYPATGLRGALLLTTVVATAGLLISQLVRSARRANEKLATSEQQFRAAFDDAPVGMALIALRGNDAGRFLRVNRALCVMFGRTAADFATAPIESWTYRDDVAVLRAWFARTVHEGASPRLEKRFLHKSGRVIWASVSFSVVRDDTDRPVHVIAQIEDISARRESDQALLDALQSERVAAAQMRELDAIRTRVLSNAAHDLRTPLTSASGFTELLLDGSAGEVTHDQREMLDTIARGIDRMSSIVDELVSTSRRHAGPSPITKLPFDLGAVLTGATQAMSIISSSAGQTFFVDNELEGVVIEGDAGRLDRALSNLIGNAVKFTPSDGTVRVIGRLEGERAVIDVEDSGIGISAEDQERIFERYYRADDANGRAISGSGLGLAIVKEIIAQHDGMISVRSEAGKGAKFTVSLPVPHPASRAASRPVSQAVSRPAAAAASVVGAREQGAGGVAHLP